MADDVERLEVMPLPRKMLERLLNEQAQTIATLRADLAKAVEGLERIATLDSDGLPSFTPQAMVAQAQSLIKELRP